MIVTMIEIMQGAVRGIAIEIETAIEIGTGKGIETVIGQETKRTMVGRESESETVKEKVETGRGGRGREEGGEAVPGAGAGVETEETGTVKKMANIVRGGPAAV